MSKSSRCTLQSSIYILKKEILCRFKEGFHLHLYKYFHFAVHEPEGSGCSNYEDCYEGTGEYDATYEEGSGSGSGKFLVLEKSFWVFYSIQKFR